VRCFSSGSFFQDHSFVFVFVTWSFLQHDDLYNPMRPRNISQSKLILFGISFVAYLKLRGALIHIFFPHFWRMLHNCTLGMWVCLKMCLYHAGILLTWHFW
jgi:hypothetical protein